MIPTGRIIQRLAVIVFNVFHFTLGGMYDESIAIEHRSKFVCHAAVRDDYAKRGNG